MARELPEDWHVAGYWTDLTPTGGNYHHSNDDIPAREIEDADRIVVFYKDPDTGVEDYRTVTGAENWDALADLIETVTMVVSPAGRGE